MPHYDYDKDYPFAAFITNLGKYNVTPASGRTTAWKFVWRCQFVRF